MGLGGGVFLVALTFDVLRVLKEITGDLSASSFFICWAGSVSMSCCSLATKVAVRN